jgi:hypothetical protein
MTALRAFHGWLPAIEAAWQRWSRGRFVAFAVAAVLGLTIFVFSPRWWLMAEPVPGSFQWARALGFIAQCEDPFRADVEPALHWRLLPPLLAHHLGLRGNNTFFIPWAGVIAFLTATAYWSSRLLPQRTSAFLLTLLVSTSSAVLVPLHWLGVNDAWVWLGLLTIVCARAPFPLAVATLLCPWIDERYLIGLPLALWCRHQMQPPGRDHHWLLLGGCTMPYAAARISAWLISSHEAAGGTFLGLILAEFHVWLPLAPLGWFMAFRAGWIVVACVFLRRSFHSFRTNATGVALAATTLALSTILAADLSRSAAIMFPLLFLGGITLATRLPARAPAILGVCALANLLIPAAHVVYRSIDHMDSLSMELYRLLR